MLDLLHKLKLLGRSYLCILVPGLQNRQHIRTVVYLLLHFGSKIHVPLYLWPVLFFFILHVGNIANVQRIILFTVVIRNKQINK